MKREIKTLFKSFGIEALVYGALVIAYFLAVLHFLGGWLQHLYLKDRKFYAVMALVLIIGQGIVLEVLTRTLLRLIGRGGKE